MLVPLTLITPLLVLLSLGGQIKHQEAMGGHRIRPLAGEWCFKALFGDGFPRVLGSLLNRLQLFRDWNYPLHQSLFPYGRTTPDTICLHSPPTLHFPNSHELSAGSS